MIVDKKNSKSLIDSDIKWLTRAVSLARKGWGHVRPNPMVGCVLVKNGKVIGEGWHEEFGGPHAEVNALKMAGSNTQGSTAYVTLEPCNHYGKTPPCTDALIKAGVSRVIFGAPDPGMGMVGGGQFLSKSGIEVSGPLSDTALGYEVDPAFFHIKNQDCTYLAVKLAISRDERIAIKIGEKTSLTGLDANRKSHYLRGGFDAILVGSETAYVDDPFLTVRHGFKPRIAPTRIVVDSKCRISSEARLLRTINEAPVLVLTTQAAPLNRIRALEKAGAQVEVVPEDNGRVNLEYALELCWKLGLTSILCEGGGKIASTFLNKGLVQRFYLFSAPISLGSQGVPAFPDTLCKPYGPGWRTTGDPLYLGSDVFITYDRKI